MNVPSVVSKSHSLQQYSWGNNCQAWSLTDSDTLSVRLEYMPAQTEEVLHYHNHSQQFFYILKGKAVFEVDDVILIVHEGDGLTIEPRRKHRIMNKEEILLEFIVISQPSTATDRYNIV